MVKGNKFKSPEFLARQQAVLETLAPAATGSGPTASTQQPAAKRQKPAGARSKQQAAQRAQAPAAKASGRISGTQQPAAGPPQQLLSKPRAHAAEATDNLEPTEARSQPLKPKRAAEESPAGRQQPAASRGAGGKQPTSLSRKQRQQGTKPPQSGAQPVLGGLHQEAGPSGKQDGKSGGKRKSRRQSAPLSVSQQQPDAMPAGPVKQTRQALPASQQRLGADPAEQAGQAAQSVKPVPAFATPASPTHAGKQSSGGQGNDGTAQSGRAPGSDRQHAPKKAALVTCTAMPAAAGAASSNWMALKATLTSGAKRRKVQAPLTPEQAPHEPLPAPKQLGNSQKLTQVVALDCEMVGVGPGGLRSMLARVCLVNNLGIVLIDELVQPQERIVDYRTRVSGVTPEDMLRAKPFKEVQAAAREVLTDRILVGHSVDHDLQVLQLQHPRGLTRDTARYPPLMRYVPGGRPRPHALRWLAEHHLGLAIQGGAHSPIDDARAALYLYHMHRKEWEQHVQKGTLKQLRVPMLKKKAVLQQLEEAAAAGIDVDMAPPSSIQQMSFEQLAAADEMADL